MSNLTHSGLARTVALSLKLQLLLDESASAQWQRSRVIQSDGDDPGIRSKGAHGDPTFDAVSDPARLALRAAVIQAEDVLTRHYAEEHEAAKVLAAALTRWNGGL